MIKSADPKAQYAAHRQAIRDAVDRVLESGQYILGDEVAAFESEFAAYCGCDHGVGVGNGTDALVVALKALGIGPGDEVITVSHTAVATVIAIALAGASPVLVDIESSYYTMDPDAAERAVTSRTRAIVPVHLYGQPADMGSIMELARRHRLMVVEDCAQAAGARWHDRTVGSIGDIGCFSFYPTKNLGAIGDGGMAVTNDPTLARTMRSLRQYGWDDDRVSTLPGRNSRLDELQAAILRIKLPYLDRENAARNRIAAAFDDLLAGGPVTAPIRRADATHVFHLYVVETDGRDRLIEALGKEGIEAGIHYPVPVHRQPACAKVLRKGSLSATEHAVGRILTLPMNPHMDGDVVRRVGRALGH